MQLANRVAYITGASGGVGLGVARAYAAEGASVVIASRNEAAGKAAVAGIERDYPQGKALFIATDVSVKTELEDSLAQAAATFGGIDILVNNATPGEGSPTRLETVTDEDLEKVLSVNYHASFWAMQKLFPGMKANGWGRIINMGSLNGINAHRYTVGYNSAKEALRALTRTAAAEWGRYGITCNVICPAAATDAWDRYVEFAPESAERILAMMPMGRMGNSEHDVGPLAVFLASDAARFITGNTIHADGGGHINGVPWSFELPE